MLKKPYHGRVGVYPCVSGSHSKHLYLQVSSGLRATVIKFTSEEPLDSLPEIYNNSNNKKLTQSPIIPFSPRKQLPVLRDAGAVPVPRRHAHYNLAGEDAWNHLGVLLR